MGKNEATFTKTIDTTPAKIWKALTDPDEIVAWFPKCKDAKWKNGGKPSLGAHRELVLKIGERDVRSEQEVTEYEPKTSFGWRHIRDTVDGKPFEMLIEPGLHFALTKDGKSTRLDVRAEWGLKGLRARLAGPMVKKVVEKETDKVLDKLKKHVEA